MSKVQRCRGSVLEVRQMIRSKAVSQCIIRPFHNASSLACLIELLPEISRYDATGMFAQRYQLHDGRISGPLCIILLLGLLLLS